MSNKTQVAAIAKILEEFGSAFGHLNFDDAEWIIQNPQHAMILFLNSIRKRRINLTPNRTITSGGVQCEELFDRLRKEKDLVHDICIQEMINDPSFFTTADTETVNFVFLSLWDLGFIKDTCCQEFMSEEFCARWSASRLNGQVIKLCKPQDGPFLRLSSDDITKHGRQIYMAMKPVVGGIFAMSDDSLSLRHWFGKAKIDSRPWHGGDDCNGYRIVYRLENI